MVGMESPGARALRLGQWKEAVSSFSRAIELNEDDWDLWRGRGRAHAELSQWNKAVDDESEAIRLKQTDWEAWYIRGVACSPHGAVRPGRR